MPPELFGTSETFFIQPIACLPLSNCENRTFPKQLDNKNAGTMALK